MCSSLFWSFTDRANQFALAWSIGGLKGRHMRWHIVREALVALAATAALVLQLLGEPGCAAAVLRGAQLLSGGQADLVVVKPSSS